MNFKDFENKQDLVGKYVLHTYGKSYSRSRAVTKIIKVTKTGFRTEKSGNNCLFDFNGNQKGITGRMNTGTISYCQLITAEVREKLLKEFRENRERREKLTKIRVAINNSSFTDLDVISQIYNILFPTQQGEIK